MLSCLFYLFIYKFAFLKNIAQLSGTNIYYEKIIICSIPASRCCIVQRQLPGPVPSD